MAKTITLFVMTLITVATIAAASSMSDGPDVIAAGLWTIASVLVGAVAVELLK